MPGIDETNGVEGMPGMAGERVGAEATDLSDSKASPPGRICRGQSSGTVVPQRLEATSPERLVWLKAFLASGLVPGAQSSMVGGPRV